MAQLHMLGRGRADQVAGRPAEVQAFAYDGVTYGLPYAIENIALVREFVADNFTSKGVVADWVYHDKDGNPHIHLMTTLRPLTEEGFGPKKVPVLGEDGEPLRVTTPDRPNGKIVYKLWAGDKETMKAWKIAWAETANRHLAHATTSTNPGASPDHHDQQLSPTTS